MSEFPVPDRSLFDISISHELISSIALSVLVVAKQAKSNQIILTRTYPT
jgi:hypothetical protein